MEKWGNQMPQYDSSDLAAADNQFASDGHFNLRGFVDGLSHYAWLDKIYLFGSRRYAGNQSFGSDIDLLFVTTEELADSALREVLFEPYIDAFVLAGRRATSVCNGTRIDVNPEEIEESLHAVLVWTRAGGWRAGFYDLIRVLPEVNPAMTIGMAGIRPILILCALPKEFAAVKKRLPHGKDKQAGTMPPYYIARLAQVPGSPNGTIVVAVLVGNGNRKAAIATTRILDFFPQASLAILVGIAGGIEEASVKLGDILIPTETVDVESGKKTSEGFESSLSTLQVSSPLHAKVAAWSGLSKWKAHWKEQSPLKAEPSVIDDCTLACTSTVCADGESANALRQKNRKIAGVEMEALGVADAANDRCKFLIIKAVSDLAGSQKNDSLHEYCAGLAADLVASLIEAGVFSALQL